MSNENTLRKIFDLNSKLSNALRDAFSKETDLASAFKLKDSKTSLKDALLKGSSSDKVANVVRSLSDTESVDDWVSSFCDEDDYESNDPDNESNEIEIKITVSSNGKVKIK